MDPLNSNFQFVCFTPIDLKLADIYLYDGFSVDGVTNTNEEPAAETVIALTACGELVPVGCTVLFENDSTQTEYVVESVTTSGGTDPIYTMTINADTGFFKLTFDGEVTTNILVDDTLLAVQNALNALDTIDAVGGVVVTGVPGTNYIVTFNDAQEIVATRFTLSTLPTGGAATWEATETGSADTSTDTITLTEGLAEIVEAGGDVTFTGRRLEIKIGEGNLTYTETVARDYMLDRGRLSDVRNGDETPMDVSFEFTWDWLSGVSASGVPTIKEVLKQQGEADDWESTDDDECAPYCVDIVVRYDPACGGDNSEVITLSQFRYETLEHNLRDSQISCSGKCNVTESTEYRI
jgi:hypothetical protein